MHVYNFPLLIEGNLEANLVPVLISWSWSCRWFWELVFNNKFPCRCPALDLFPLGFSLSSKTYNIFRSRKTKAYCLQFMGSSLNNVVQIRPFRARPLKEKLINLSWAGCLYISVFSSQNLPRGLNYWSLKAWYCEHFTITSLVNCWRGKVRWHFEPPHLNFNSRTMYRALADSSRKAEYEK